MKTAFRVLIIVIAAMFLSTAYAQMPVQNRSVLIRAKVLKVEKLQFPKVRLTLKIIRSSNNNLINPQKGHLSIKAYNNDNKSDVWYLFRAFALCLFLSMDLREFSQA
jgi:hypothetical protein